MSGSKKGHVTIWSNSTSKSRKIFNNSEQTVPSWKNATFVRYVNGKIFTIAKFESQLHILDLELNTLKVVDHQFKGQISVMESTTSFIAIGECHFENVTVFDNNGNHVLVSNFSL